MSRTINTMPYDVQVKKREAWRRRHRGYPDPYGNLLKGRGAAGRRRNKLFRLAQKAALRQGRELPVQKKGVMWDIT